MKRTTSSKRRIKSISIEGFKSFKEQQTIRLGKITVLAGPNSSGKSTFMQPLLLIKQTEEEQADYGPILLSGPLAKFSNFQQLFWHKAEDSGKQNYSVRITTDKPTPEWFEQSYSLQRKGQGGDNAFGLQESKFHDEGKDYDFKRDAVARLQQLPPGVSSLYGKYRASRIEDVEFNVTSKKGFMVFEEKTDYNPFVWNPMRMLADSVRGIIHLPGLRGNPAREYPLSYAGPQGKEPSSYTGSFLNYVAGIVYSWGKSSDKDNQMKIQKLNEYLSRLHFTSGVTVQPISDVAAEIRVQRVIGEEPDSSDMVSIADVGLGLSQTLPVLVGLLAANADSIVHIEQPEIHLHPRAQYDMAEIIADTLGHSDARVIVETHSPLFILGLQTLVAKRVLGPNDVSLNWLSRNDEGATTVTATALDESGHFGDWPVDFDEAALYAEGEFVTAQMEHQGN